MKNCLLLINQRKVRVSLCAWLGMAVCANVLNAADIVPDLWNVAPMTSGAYLQSFESGLPAWASLTGASVTTNQFPSMDSSGLPARSNAWFSSSSNVMALDTEGTIISNELQNSSAGSVSFASESVYVDMKVRFNSMEDDPDPAVLANCKLAVFVNSEFKLVVAHNGGCSTNETVLDTNKWHQITVVMSNGTCNVYRNDLLVFPNLTLNSSGTANELGALSFKGAGYVDELYVSRCAPDYPVEGPTTTIPTLPGDGGNVPTDEQQTKINKWLSDQSGLTSLGTMTQDQLSQAYLVNEIDTPTGAALNIDFGISAIDVIDDVTLKITAILDVDSIPKAGAINGRIQLQGKKTKAGAWENLSGAVTPGSVSFSSGEMVFTYTIPGGGYRFFRGQIIP